MTNAETFRSAGAGLAIASFNVGAWLSSIDIGKITSGVTVLGGAVVALWYTHKQKKLRIEQAENRAKREERIKDIALSIRETRLKTRAALASDKMLGPTYGKQIEEIKEALEEAKGDRVRLAERLAAAEENERRAKDEANRLMTYIAQNLGPIKQSVMEISAKVGPDRVLVVEDDEKARTVLSRLLVLEGFACVEAGTIAEAMEHLNGSMREGGKVFDFIALDLMLPDGDGIDVLHFVKAKELACHVVVMTGKSKGEALKDAYRSFADLVVPKPIQNFPALVAAMRAMKNKSPRPTITDVPTNGQEPAESVEVK